MPPCRPFAALWGLAPSLVPSGLAARLLSPPFSGFPLSSPFALFSPPGCGRLPPFCLSAPFVAPGFLPPASVRLFPVPHSGLPPVRALSLLPVPWGCWLLLPVPPVSPALRCARLSARPACRGPFGFSSPLSSSPPRFGALPLLLPRLGHSPTPSLLGPLSRVVFLPLALWAAWFPRPCLVLLAPLPFFCSRWLASRLPFPRTSRSSLRLSPLRLRASFLRLPACACWGPWFSDLALRSLPPSVLFSLLRAGPPGVFPALPSALCPFVGFGFPCLCRSAFSALLALVRLGARALGGCRPLAVALPVFACRSPGSFFSPAPSPPPSRLALPSSCRFAAAPSRPPSSCLPFSHHRFPAGLPPFPSSVLLASLPLLAPQAGFRPAPLAFRLLSPFGSSVRRAVLGLVLSAPGWLPRLGLSSSCPSPPCPVWFRCFPPLPLAGCRCLRCRPSSSLLPRVSLPRRVPSCSAFSGSHSLLPVECLPLCLFAFPPLSLSTAVCYSGLFRCPLSLARLLFPPSLASPSPWFPCSSGPWPVAPAVRLASLAPRRFSSPRPWPANVPLLYVPSSLPVVALICLPCLSRLASLFPLRFPPSPAPPLMSLSVPSGCSARSAAGLVCPAFSVARHTVLSRPFPRSRVCLSPPSLPSSPRVLRRFPLGSPLFPPFLPLLSSCHFPFCSCYFCLPFLRRLASRRLPVVRLHLVPFFFFFFPFFPFPYDSFLRFPLPQLFGFYPLLVFLAAVRACPPGVPSVLARPRVLMLGFALGVPSLLPPPCPCPVAPPRFSDLLSPPPSGPSVLPPLRPPPPPFCASRALPSRVPVLPSFRLPMLSGAPSICAVHCCPRSSSPRRFRCCRPALPPPSRPYPPRFFPWLPPSPTLALVLSPS